MISTRELIVDYSVSVWECGSFCFWVRSKSVFHLKKHQIDDFFSAFVGFDLLKSKNLKKKSFMHFQAKNTFKKHHTPQYQTHITCNCVEVQNNQIIFLVVKKQYIKGWQLCGIFGGFY